MGANKQTKSFYNHIFKKNTIGALRTFIQNNPMTCVNGAEPESIEETETWADGIIETAKY